jgi:hypothetical protein
LRLCSIAARGLWAEMMCVMHDAEPYGSLLVNGKRIDKKQLAGLASITERDCTALLLELEGNGVFSRDHDGTIYSRRMRRDHAKAIKDKENGKGGGNPRLKGGVNPQDKGMDKAQKLEARTSEARASDAGASDDPRTRLFRDGLAKLAKLTGKGPDACRSFVGKCLKAASDDAVTVLGLIEDAERNQVVDPSAWIASRLKGPDHGKPKSAESFKPLTASSQNLPSSMARQEASTTTRRSAPRSSSAAIARVTPTIPRPMWRRSRPFWRAIRRRSSRR